MDFKLEYENHLGNLGVPPEEGENKIYAHSQFNLKTGEKVQITLRDLTILRTLRDLLQKKDQIKYQQTLK